MTQEHHARTNEIMLDHLIARWITELRIANELTPQELADRSGVPQMEIQHHEAGLLPISLPRMLSLLSILLQDNQSCSPPMKSRKC